MIYFIFLNILCSSNDTSYPNLPTQENVLSLKSCYGDDIYTIMEDMSDIIKNDYPDLHMKIYGINEKVNDINMEIDEDIDVKEYSNNTSQDILVKNDAKELESDFILNYIRNYKYTYSSDKILTHFNLKINSLIISNIDSNNDNLVLIQYHHLLNGLIKRTLFINNYKRRKVNLISRSIKSMTYKEIFISNTSMIDFLRQTKISFLFMKINDHTINPNYLLLERLFDKITHHHLPNKDYYLDLYSYRKLVKTFPDISTFNEVNDQKNTKYLELFVFNLLDKLTVNIDSFILYQVFIYINIYPSQERRCHKLFSLMVLIKNYHFDRDMFNISLDEYIEYMSLLIKTCNNNLKSTNMRKAEILFKYIYKLRIKLRMRNFSSEESKQLLRMIGFLVPYLVSHSDLRNNQKTVLLLRSFLESDNIASMFYEESVRLIMIILQQTCTKYKLN